MCAEWYEKSERPTFITSQSQAPLLKLLVFWPLKPDCMLGQPPASIPLNMCLLHAAEERHTVFSALYSRAQWRLLAMPIRIPDPVTAWQKSSLQSVHVTNSDSIAPLVRIPFKWRTHAVKKTWLFSVQKNISPIVVVDRGRVDWVTALKNSPVISYKLRWFKSQTISPSSKKYILNH